MSKVYALLVGINDYPEKVGKLQGCLNDVDNVRAYLAESIPDAAVIMLKDYDATRDNLIKQFREHLGQAGKDDVALFHYCGHGANSTAAPEFRDYDLLGKDQGLVCIDSRDSDDTWDFADKELAVLLEELARDEPHIALILDCCNSGSGTRALEAPGGQGVRTTGGVPVPRPLETYIGGYYAERAKRGEPLTAPGSRHMLLAACDRRQTAKEDLDTHQGIFTTRLFEVMRRAPGGMSYADLFVRSRAAVRRYVADNGKTPQDPQFEAYGDFDAYAGVLGRGGAGARRTYSVYRDADRWQVDCGAIQGMPLDPAQPATLALVGEEDGGERAGLARTVRVGAQKSEVSLDFEADPALRYKAEIISLPAPPLLIGFAGDAIVRASLQAALDADDSANVTLTEAGAGEGYRLDAEAERLVLRLKDREKPIQSVATRDPNWPKAAVRLLAHVAQWERGLALANPRPKLDPGLVEFVFAESLAGGGEYVHEGPELTLETVQIEGSWRAVGGKLKLRNRTGQLLHYTLLHLSEAYGIQVMANDQIEPKADEWMTLTVGIAKPLPEVNFWLDGEATQAIERLKLILSTERVDDFLLELPPLSDERGFGSAAESPVEAAKALTDDWFTKDLRVSVVRRLSQIGPQAARLAGGAITIEPHPTVTANLSLSAARSEAREAGAGPDFRRTLEARGFGLVDLSGARGAQQNVLELTDIANAGDLKATPLQIRIDAPLAEGEAILPILYDGQHMLLAGDSWRGDDGATHVSIDEVPEIDIGRRSLGGALKMYFYKAWLGRDDVNRLRWVDFRPDGGCVYNDGDVAEKVAGASNILLVAHGIIGDTAPMLGGVEACGLNARFDLVLSYDYENLSTPIEETAAKLGQALATVGLNATDNKILTFMVHSMGGLVSRWFIERLDGNRIVDHLVLCGTPSLGSPFGRIDGARKLLNMLATVAVNYVPAVAGPAMWLLSRSKKLTPTLEQMHPESAFITALNASPDPGIPYTILAGDVDAYREPADAYFEALLAKTGRGALFDALFGNRPNDIAVGVESILGVGERGGPPPERRNVPCHHLNYFSSPAGQLALREVKWDRPAAAVPEPAG